MIFIKNFDRKNIICPGCNGNIIPELGKGRFLQPVIGFVCPKGCMNISVSRKINTHGIVWKVCANSIATYIYKNPLNSKIQKFFQISNDGMEAIYRIRTYNNFNVPSDAYFPVPWFSDTHVYKNLKEFYLAILDTNYTNSAAHFLLF